MQKQTSYETTHILLHSHFPHHSWGMLYPCYLINQMSSIFNDQVPLCAFPHSPLLSLPPRVFYTTCFVLNLTPGQVKLSP